jgi:hypothetical protein
VNKAKAIIVNEKYKLDVKLRWYLIPEKNTVRIVITITIRETVNTDFPLRYVCFAFNLLYVLILLPKYKQLIQEKNPRH